MENRHKRFKELRDHFRACWPALHSVPISDSFRGANQLGQYGSLSGGDPGQPTHLVASHRTGEQENFSKDGLAGPLLNRSDLSIRNGVLLYKQLIRPLKDYACPAWRSAARTHTSGGCKCYNPSVFALVRVPLCSLVTGRFTRIWVFLL